MSWWGWAIFFIVTGNLTTLVLGYLHKSWIDEQNAWARTKELEKEADLVLYPKPRTSIRKFNGKVIPIRKTVPVWNVDGHYPTITYIPTPPIGMPPGM